MILFKYLHYRVPGGRLRIRKRVHVFVHESECGDAHRFVSPCGCSTYYNDLHVILQASLEERVKIFEEDHKSCSRCLAWWEKNKAEVLTAEKMMSG